MDTPRLNRILIAAVFATLGVTACAGVWVLYSGAMDQRSPESKIAAALAGPQWTVDQNIASRLRHRIDLKDGKPHIRIDVPPEYSAQVSEGPGGKTLLLRGPSRKDRTQSVLIVSSLPNRGPSDKKSFTLSEGFPLYLAAIKSGRRDKWQETKSESGSINGQPFMRAQWSGIEPVSKKLMRGFLYGTVVDDQFVVMSAQDFEQYVPHVMPALNATALTLQLVK